MIFSAYFSEAGVPKTGLSPTIDIWNFTDNNLDVNDGVMTEAGGGFYFYDHSTGDVTDTFGTIADSVTLTGDERYAIGDYVPILSVANITAGIMDEVIDEDAIGNVTMKQSMIAMLAMLAGRTTGVGSATEVFRNPKGDKSRATFTYDSNNNRLTVSFDFS